MGYINHRATIITYFNFPDKEPDLLRNFIASLPKESQEKLIVRDAAVNGYRLLIIPPDGSKEGWRESDETDTLADLIVERATHTKGVFADCVTVAFGGDEPSARIHQFKQTDEDEE